MPSQLTYVIAVLALALVGSFTITDILSARRRRRGR